MKGVSEKVFLRLPDASVSDDMRLRQALQALGYGQVTLPLQVLRKLQPLVAQGQLTVTLVHREADCVVVDVQAGDQSHSHYGLAVDLGSTMVLMGLVDMRTGTVIGQEKALNGQAAFGSDILSRITYSLETPAHVDALHRATVQTLEQLMAQLTEATGIRADTCPVMILSGNTTMIHFLLKLNAWTVFAAPYTPVCTAPGFLWGRELEMDFAGLVYIIPAASNYIGGDIVSGLLTLELHKQEEVGLFFDIGTNGELVIGNRDWLLAGAGAAGPALEGYISRFGMRAAPGAVDSVQIRGPQLSYTTVENAPARGICGSGIIDLLAQMRLSGWINIAGELDPQASPEILYLEETQEYAAVYARNAQGQPLYFSQTDIRQYLDTKAAAYTMVECLLETAGVPAEQLNRLYLSGAFTVHADLEAAITLGMFPDVPRERYAVIANTSFAGACRLLTDRTLLQEAQQLAESIYCVQFASIPDFLVRMQAAKFIPHTDLDRFPAIQSKLSH